MPIKRYKPEQIVTLLRQIEVGIANGEPTPQACNEAEITVQTYYPLAQGVWWAEVGTSDADEGTGEREHAAEAVSG